MQRAGKFPGILETFHGKFREFWRGGNFRKFWEFSILTYFQHFMRLFAQKSTELNLLCNIFEHTCSALLSRQFIGLCGSTERTTRLYYEITLDLICLVFYRFEYFMLFHIVFRIWKEIQIEKKIFFLSFTVNTILMFTKQEV